MKYSSLVFTKMLYRMDLFSHKIISNIEIFLSRRDLQKNKYILPLNMALNKSLLNERKVWIYQRG